MKLQCLIISVILVSLFCGYSDAADTNRQSFLLISALGNEQLPAPNLVVEMKSPAKAALFSFVVPGTGELYCGAKRGYIHMVAEVGLFAAYVFLHRDAEDMREDCKGTIRKYVKFDPEYSGSKNFDKWTWEDYEHATMFDDWHNVYTESDGAPIDRVGPFHWKDPGGLEHRQEALDLREKSNDKFQLARGFLGGVILNHLISAIDARVLAKKHNQKAKKTLPITFKIDLSDEFVSGKIVFEKQF